MVHFKKKKNRKTKKFYLFIFSLSVSFYLKMSLVNRL